MRPATILLPARNYTASEESGHPYAGARSGGEKFGSDEMNVAKRSRPVMRGASPDPVKDLVEGLQVPPTDLLCRLTMVREVVL